MVNNTWDYETDFLVAGTGAAGMSAAITANKNGLDVIVVESAKVWGGTTAISGGGLWMPNNPLMKEDGVEDDPDAAFSYLQDTVGNVGPWTSDERKWAFINGVTPFMQLMADEGIEWARAADYPDYYPDLPGGRIGRGVEVYPFNVRKLGAYRKLMQKGGLPVAAMTNDIWLLTRPLTTWQSFWRGARFTFRQIFHPTSIGMGGAYASSLMYIIQQREIPVWLNSPITEVIKDDTGRVIGAVVDKEGRDVRVKAGKGVMLGAGGFAQNKEWRKKYHGVEGWSAAPLEQLGQGITVGEKAGGDLAMMEDAWWGATTANPDGKQQHGFILNERSDPWSLVVDQTGKRYLNESESYVDFGHHMLEHNKKSGGKAIPSWLVVDHRHSTHFLNSTLLIPGAKKKLLEQGEMVEADTLEELGEQMKVDRKVFQEQIARFNEFATEGIDRDFQRGRTAYDNYYGNPNVKPNPNLGTIEKGPFRAFKLYPGDLGTKGGLVTDEWARVLDKKGNAIPGLYSAGNNSAAVMGHTYPGAGSTIGPASVFGYLAALHASQPADTKVLPGIER